MHTERLTVRVCPADLSRLDLIQAHVERRRPYATRSDAVRLALQLAASAIVAGTDGAPAVRPPSPDERSDALGRLVAEGPAPGHGR